MDTYETSVLRHVLTTVLVLSTCLLHVDAVNNECFGDRCNRGNEEQFCSTHFKLCRNCADIVDDCGTTRQPISCTSYCISYRVKMELEKIQERTCSVPKMPAHGFIVPLSHKDSPYPIGSNISFACEESYILTGPQTMTCLGNNTWTGDNIPFCLDDSYIIWQNVGKVLAAIIPVAIVIALVIYCKECVYRCLTKTDQKGQPTKRDTDSRPESGIESLTEEDETSLMMIYGRSQTQQKPKMDDELAENKVTEESLTTTKAIEETSGKGTEQPNRATQMRTSAVNADATETINDNPKMVGFEDRTFHANDA